MHNLITLTNYRTRLALYSQAKNSGGTPAAPAPVVPDGVRQQIERPAEQLLRYLLFANETPLGGIDGARLINSSPFAQEFAARGIRDPKGRSLRDFDLSTRIFRYPCSYLIYSDAFDALPEPAKGYVFHRLLEILSGQDQSQDFAKVSGQGPSGDSRDLARHQVRTSGRVEGLRKDESHQGGGNPSGPRPRKTHRGSDAMNRSPLRCLLAGAASLICHLALAATPRTGRTKRGHVRGRCGTRRSRANHSSADIDARQPRRRDRAGSSVGIRSQPGLAGQSG